MRCREFSWMNFLPSKQISKTDIVVLGNLITNRQLHGLHIHNWIEKLKSRSDWQIQISSEYMRFLKKFKRVLKRWLVCLSLRMTIAAAHSDNPVEGMRIATAKPPKKHKFNIRGNLQIFWAQISWATFLIYNLIFVCFSLMRILNIIYQIIVHTYGNNIVGSYVKDPTRRRREILLSSWFQNEKSHR